MIPADNMNTTTAGAVVIVTGYATTSDWDNDTEYTNSLEMYYQVKNLYHTWLGVVMTALCCIGMVTNLLNIVALTTIARRSKLPVYRCFLALSVADFMVSVRYCV